MPKGDKKKEQLKQRDNRQSVYPVSKLDSILVVKGYDGDVNTMTFFTCSRKSQELQTFLDVYNKIERADRMALSDESFSEMYVDAAFTKSVDGWIIMEVLEEIFEPWLKKSGDDADFVRGLLGEVRYRFLPQCEGGGWCEEITDDKKKEYYTSLFGDETEFKSSNVYGPYKAPTCD